MWNFDGIRVFEKIKILRIFKENIGKMFVLFPHILRKFFCFFWKIERRYSEANRKKFSVVSQMFFLSCFFEKQSKFSDGVARNFFTGELNFWNCHHPTRKNGAPDPSVDKPASKFTYAVCDQLSGVYLGMM